MTLFKIARMGHPVLVRCAGDIPDPTAREIRHLVENMIETMIDAQGVGLAAPQVHVSKRVIIFNSPEGRSGDPEPKTDFAPLTALINPKIEVLDKEQDLGWEGCLSVPGLTGAVPRYRRIRYQGLAPDGTTIEREATGFHARVVQHECDHLDGILYTMRMPDLSMLSFTEELQRRTRSDEGEITDGDNDIVIG
ncbi:peptide deformylase [Alphaproteobacteria bacterium]|nr:peptide deformylase [Alphaproteobacteria bacterium]